MQQAYNDIGYLCRLGPVNLLSHRRTATLRVGDFEP